MQDIGTGDLGRPGLWHAVVTARGGRGREGGGGICSTPFQRCRVGTQAERVPSIVACMQRVWVRVGAIEQGAVESM